MGKKIKIAKAITNGGAQLGAGMIVGAVVGHVLPVSALRFVPKVLVYMGVAGLSTGVGEFAGNSTDKVFDALEEVVETFSGDIKKANEKLQTIKVNETKTQNEGE